MGGIRRRDLTGMTFGRLTVIEARKMRNRQTRSQHWLCKCSCGASIITRADSLTSRKTQSCGCLNREISVKQKEYHFPTLHGLSKSVIYNRWHAMMNRCYDKNVIGYENYGGRGIFVAESWHKFENFFADMGHPPRRDLSLERKDNDGPYCKGNCVWATAKEQAANRRTPVIVRDGNLTIGQSDKLELIGVKKQE